MTEPWTRARPTAARMLAPLVTVPLGTTSDYNQLHPCGIMEKNDSRLRQCASGCEADHIRRMKLDQRLSYEEQPMTPSRVPTSCNSCCAVCGSMCLPDCAFTSLMNASRLEQLPLVS